MSNNIVGTFAAPGTEAEYRLHSCNPTAGGVTHNSATDKTLTIFTWTAPSSGGGDVEFA